MAEHPIHLSRAWRIPFGVASVIALSIAFLFARQAQNTPADEQWFVVSLGGTPVGYIRESEPPGKRGPNALRVSFSELKMILNRLGTKVELEMTTRTEETPDGRLKKAVTVMRASQFSTKSEALIGDGAIEMRNEAGGKSYSRTVPYTGTILGPEGIRRLSLAKLKGPGDRIEFQTFAAELETASAASQTGLGWETIRVDGRDRRVLKVEEIISVGGTKTQSWIDENHDTIRQEMPTPFGVAQIILATREQAILAAGGASLPDEIYTRSIIRTNIRLPRARTLNWVKLRLTRRDSSGEWPDLSGPYQKIAAKTSALLELEIRRPVLPGPVQRPVAITDSNREFLAPNAYVQSDDPGLRRTAAAVSGKETDVWKTALKLERWVAENMHFDLGIALAPSTELFMNRRGTCLGYATLLAALTRAAGIPSRVAMGYVYAQGMFGGHAWTEILVDGVWVPLDSAIVAPGTADPARFSLTTSSLFGGAGSLMGGPAQALFGQIDVRILEFAGPDGRSVAVPQDAPPYRLDGGVYDNRWLGVSVMAPKGWKFAKLDAVWPDPAIFGLEGPNCATAELQEAAFLPWEDAGAGLKRALERSVPGGKEMRLRISGRSSLALESSGKAALGVSDGPQVWVLVVSGKDASAVLAQLAAGCVFK